MSGERVRGLSPYALVEYVWKLMGEAISCPLARKLTAHREKSQWQEVELDEQLVLFKAACDSRRRMA